jgi:hypothetical protein
MNLNASVQPAVARGVRNIISVLTAAGIVGLVMAAMLAFEEPPMPMLLVSGAMALATPIAVLVHLSVTRSLTHEEKRIWAKELGSAQIWSALSEYLSSTNLSESARRRNQDARGRRESQ